MPRATCTTLILMTGEVLKFALKMGDTVSDPPPIRF
jgi:hypothetical protein